MKDNDGEDEKWIRSTDLNKDKLQRLADEVLEADRHGKREPLDPNAS